MSGIHIYINSCCNHLHMHICIYANMSRYCSTRLYSSWSNLTVGAIASFRHAPTLAFAQRNSHHNTHPRPMPNKSMNLSQTRPKKGHVRSGRLRSNLTVGFCRNLADFDRNCPTLVGFGKDVIRSNSAKSGRIRAKVGRTRPTSGAECGPRLEDSTPKLTGVGLRHRPKSHHCWPMLSRCCEFSGHGWADSGKPWSDDAS